MLCQKKTMFFSSSMTTERSVNIAHHQKWTLKCRFRHKKKHNFWLSSEVELGLNIRQITHSSTFSSYLLHWIAFVHLRTWPQSIYPIRMVWKSIRILLNNHAHKQTDRHIISQERLLFVQRVLWYNSFRTMTPFTRCYERRIESMSENRLALGFRSYLLEAHQIYNTIIYSL